MMHWFDRVKRAILTGSSFALGHDRRNRPLPRRAILGFEPLELRLTLAAMGLVPMGSQPTGTLSGKIVYTSPGHGYQYDAGAWRTGRGNNNDIVEDFGNQDQFTYYVDYLFRAGATVVPMRPVGRQTNEVVLDNDLAAVTYSGSWSNSTTATRWYDEDYGAVADSVRYRFASTSSTETATATYTPNIPAAGMYPVYTWVAPGTNRTSQLYKINHTGGQTQVRVDHTMVGNGWVYLGTYHFNAGSSATEGSVVISNQGTAGSVVIADAIRFGNGMGDLAMGSGGIGTGTISGKPREEEHSLLWIWRGYGQYTASADNPFSVLPTDSSDSFVAPAIMAGRMNVDTNPFGTSVYIGFHSNAASASARGATGLYSTTSATPHQSSLATYVARQIETDMLALGYSWGTRTYATGGAYGEINNTYYHSEMDSIIIEVAFHTNVTDSAIMRDPQGRDQIARSVYEGTLEYFRNWGTTPVPANTTLPSAPTNVRAVSNSSGQVTLNWAAGPVGGGVAGALGNAATGFRIYASSDGYGFDGGTFVSGGGSTAATLTGLDPALPYYFKVAAINAGGESKPTEVVTALPSGGVKQVLIVNGFDRFDESQNFRYTTPLVLPGGTNVTTDRVWSRYNNSFDYVVQVHTAIDDAKPGVHVASTSNEAVISGAVNLSDYHTVIWILGTESTVDDTFNATEQTKVTNFINAGGNLFLSGSEIAWDLDQQNNGRTFFESTLKGNYVADSAATNTATADAGGIFAGMNSFVFSSGSTFNSLDGQMYNVNSADIIAPQSGAVAALTYSGGTGVRTAAIQVQGTGGKGSIVMFGFPFETMTSATRRENAIDRILDFFSLSAPAPAVDIKTRVNGQDADSPTGPVLEVGSSVTFTYVLTNPGNVPLTSVVVKDNNGTPGNAADDITLTTHTGDSVNPGQLDVGETWTYTLDRTVVVGQYSNIGSVTAVGNAQNISDTDPANYLGVVPNNADFNGDSVIDAADYVIWRHYDGLTSGTQSQGDANGNGQVNEEDYDLWGAQFGSTPGGGAAEQGGSGAAAIEEQASEAFSIQFAAVESPVFSEEMSDKSSAAQDAVFSTLAAGGNELRTYARPHARLQERLAARAERGDWAAIIAALAERKAQRASDDHSDATTAERGVCLMESTIADGRALDGLVERLSAKFKTRAAQGR